MLSELLEEYKEVDELDKINILNEFKSKLWGSKYIFKTYKKNYTYKVNEELLHNRKDLIELFNKYKTIEFTFCKSYYKKRASPIDYIRIHINNMYGYLVEKEVYLPKEYYQLLLTPKKEYYIAIDKLKNGEKVNRDEIKSKIEFNLMEAVEIKKQAIEKKIDLSWHQYKKLINKYIERLFNNYLPPHEYENEHGWKLQVEIDSWNENNYIVKYFCKSLTGYMRNYVNGLKPKKIKKKYCIKCGKEIILKSNKQKYCDKCWKERNKELKRNWWNKNKH